MFRHGCKHSLGHWCILVTTRSSFRLFANAKAFEVSSFIKTEAVRRYLNAEEHKEAKDTKSILRARWVLVWTDVSHFRWQAKGQGTHCAATLPTSRPLRSFIQHYIAGTKSIDEAFESGDGRSARMDTGRFGHEDRISHHRRIFFGGSLVCPQSLWPHSEAAREPDIDLRPRLQRCLERL